MMKWRAPLPHSSMSWFGMEEDPKAGRREKQVVLKKIYWKKIHKQGYSGKTKLKVLKRPKNKVTTKHQEIKHTTEEKQNSNNNATQTGGNQGNRSKLTDEIRNTWIRQSVGGSCLVNTRDQDDNNKWKQNIRRKTKKSYMRKQNQI